MTRDLGSDGFAVLPGALSASECSELARLASEAGSGRAGGTRRLLELPWCRSLARRLRERLTLLATGEWVAVQCTYFEKSTVRNWLVPLHQDLAIPVKEKTGAPGFSAWSRKDGEVFVQPPVQVLEQLVAVRIHLDPCTDADGPLQAVPGSHALGVLTAGSAWSTRQAHGTVACVAAVGDALLMRPLLLHASSKASGTSTRRVLHFLFGPPGLPHGVRWRHAV